MLALLFTLFTSFIISFVVAQQPAPGYGNVAISFDHLTSQHGGLLFQESTTLNCTTPDGKYKLPCGYHQYIIQKTDSSITTQIYNSVTDFWRDDQTTIKVSASASFLGIKLGGSYSDFRENYVHLITSENRTFVDSYLQMLWYQIYVDEMTMTLSNEVKAYFKFMSKYIDANDTASYEYMLALFASRYPYTWVYQVDVGGRAEETVLIDSQYYMSLVKNVEHLQAIASVSCSFLNFAANYDHSVTQQEINTFRSYSSDQEVVSVGGQYFPSQSLSGWEATVVNNPGVITAYLDKTNFFWNSIFLPEINETHLERIANDYEIIYNEYFANNTYSGCTSPTAINFKLAANIDDGSCVFNNNSVGSAYGGYFFTVTPSGKDPVCPYPNPLTGGCSCPFNNVYSAGIRWEGFFTYTTYVCTSSSVSDTIGPSVGGAYSPGAQKNAITNDYSCPSGYTPQTQANGNVLCLGTSDGYYYGGQYVVSDAGCLLANPYTSNCGCPPQAPYISVSLMTVIRMPQPYNTINVFMCYGGPKFTPHQNPGPPSVYQPINIPNPPNQVIKDLMFNKYIHV